MTRWAVYNQAHLSSLLQHQTQVAPRTNYLVTSLGVTAKVGRMKLDEDISKRQTQSWGRMNFNTPVAVVDLGLCAEQLLLASLVGQVTTDLVAVFLGLQHGDQVNTGPHLLTCELAAKGFSSQQFFQFQHKTWLLLCALSSSAASG